MMKGLTARVLVIVGTAVLLAGLSAVPASAVAIQGPTLKVFNPNPGDVLPRGRLIFLGQAWDPAAGSGPGVDRIAVYAGDRDKGAIWLGTAGKATCQSGNCPAIGGRNQGPANFQGGSIGLTVPQNGWSLKSRITLRKIHSGSFYFYARSSVTGVETLVKVDNIRIDPGRAAGQVQP